MDTQLQHTWRCKMKIASYELEQQATSTYTRVEKLEVDIQNIRITQRPVLPPIEVAISDDALQVTKAEAENLFNLSDEDKAKIKMIEDFISYLTGKRFKFKQFLKMDEDSHAKTSRYYDTPRTEHVPRTENVSRAESVPGTANSATETSPVRSGGLPPNATLNIGMIHAKHVVSESENMTFQSQGVVKTADGKTIDFNVNLELSHESLQMQELDMVSASIMVDPLVVNFDGKGVAFGEDSIQLDITLDGKADVFRNLAAGSGFLAFDRNNNGKVDDGTELFGPTLGSGFQELAAFDGDQNGWIDESDAIFKELKIWTVSPSGEKTLIGLKEADVGAIFLGKVGSEFNVRSEGDTVAKIRDSSVYLKENGGAGVIHEIDLKI